MADSVTGIQVDFGLNSQSAPSSLLQAAQSNLPPCFPFFSPSSSSQRCSGPLTVILSADAISPGATRCLQALYEQ